MVHVAECGEQCDDEDEDLLVMSSEVVDKSTEEYVDCLSMRLRLCCCLQSAFCTRGADDTDPSADVL